MKLCQFRPEGPNRPVICGRSLPCREHQHAAASEKCSLCGSNRVAEDDDGHSGALQRGATGAGVCWVRIASDLVEGQDGFCGQLVVCGACVADAVRREASSVFARRAAKPDPIGDWLEKAKRGRGETYPGKVRP